MTTKRHYTTANDTADFQSGHLALMYVPVGGLGAFYMSAPRGPLSHTLSTAEGYSELQITAFY